MKSENQIIVRCKQPIKNLGAIGRLLPFYYNVGERNILQTVFVNFFSFFGFRIPSKVIIIVMQFKFLGKSIFWALHLLFRFSFLERYRVSPISFTLYIYILHII